MDVFVSSRSNASQLVPLDLDSKPITVLCQMGDFGCGDGGWTPLMKIDGSKVSPIRRNILGGVFLRVATLFWFVISNKVQPAKSTSPSGGMAGCYKGHRQTSYLVPHHLFFSPRIYYFAERLQSFVFQIDCIKFV